MNVPLICSYEIQVPDSLPRCIRILVNWNTDKAQKEIVHAYVNDAKQLRPDLCQLPPVDKEELEGWISEYIESHETGNDSD
jgi:chorismate mutase